MSTVCCHFPQVVKRANGVKYGLCAVLWTKDSSRSHRVSQQLDVRMSFLDINSCFV